MTTSGIQNPITSDDFKQILTAGGTCFASQVIDFRCSCKAAREIKYILSDNTPICEPCFKNMSRAAMVYVPTLSTSCAVDTSKYNQILYKHYMRRDKLELRRENMKERAEQKEKISKLASERAEVFHTILDGKLDTLRGTTQKNDTFLEIPILKHVFKFLGMDAINASCVSLVWRETFIKYFPEWTFDVKRFNTLVERSAIHFSGLPPGTFDVFHELFFEKVLNSMIHFIEEEITKVQTWLEEHSEEVQEPRGSYNFVDVFEYRIYAQKNNKQYVYVFDVHQVVKNHFEINMDIALHQRSPILMEFLLNFFAPQFLKYVRNSFYSLKEMRLDDIITSRFAHMKLFLPFIDTKLLLGDHPFMSLFK